MTKSAILLIAFACSLSLRTANAQPDASCTASVAASGEYGRCALWLDGNRLKRGKSGETLTRPGFLRPMRLLDHVTGDSAQAYARSYARNTRTATTLSLIGTALLAAAYIVADSYDCDPEPSFGFCTNGDDNYVFTTIALTVGAIGFGIASAPFTLRARRHAAQAVLWHNERFAR
jgi:hypothetical protein